MIIQIMMNIKKILINTGVILAIFVLACPAFAVTEREMEQARTIAAKAYLRYANDGSGYLDEVKATSIAELRKQLKEKERENIKAFIAIPVPSDYPSWTKDKLIEYWSTTALNTAGLVSKGKVAKSRIRRQIGEMSVSAPDKQEPAKAEEPAAETPQAAVKSDIPSSLTDESELQNAPATDVAQDQTDILKDQNAIAADAQNVSLEKQDNSTWVYVLVLCILIAAVIWLVAYAAKVMKRQNAREEAHGAAIADNVSAELRKELSTRDETISKLNQRLHDEQERCIETSRTAERLKLDNQRLNDQLEKIRAERTRLQNRVEDLENQLADIAAAARAPRAVEASPSARLADTATPEPEPAPKEPEILKVIYLGRANSRGIFVRADRRVSPGNTIYRLDTDDGLVGTFHVVDLPAVTRAALENPLELLGGGCSARDIEDSVGATSIVTESSGTAIFENGCWKVLRKSRIRYE